MKARMKSAPNVPTKQKIDSTNNVPPKKKNLQKETKKENVKTPAVTTRESNSPKSAKNVRIERAKTTVNKITIAPENKVLKVAENQILKTPMINARENSNSKIVIKKKEKKVNLICKKSFTEIDSSASISFFERKFLKQLPAKPPIPKPRLNLTKNNKPVNPVNPVKEPPPPPPVKKQESEEKPKVKKVKCIPKPKKVWNEYFNSPKKDEVKVKKLKIKVDPCKEIISQALATGAKKLASDREKLNTGEQKRKVVKETPKKVSKEFKKSSAVKRAPVKVSEINTTETVMEYQPIEVDKSNVIDKFKNEVAFNIFSKLFINYVKNEADGNEKPEENSVCNLPLNQRKQRWNLKSIKRKRKRVRGITDLESSFNGKFFEDSIIKLKRHNTEPHSYRGFIWRHPSDMPNCNDYSVTSLKHLNTDDLEDFVFWETVPPKSTSCWEVSLYQSKKPWSVLSCSVFKSNRMSNTPGLILENLRNGRFCDYRIPSNGLLRLLPRSNSFDVEPSIAQKNIDIRNWVAALNFDTPEPGPILSERNLNEQNAGETVRNKKGINFAVPSDCILKEKKRKMKHEGKKTPGKRGRGAFEDHSKMQFTIPPAENMKLVNGVFLDKEVKVIDFGKKNDILKSLTCMRGPVKEEKCVYMVQIAKNKSASDKIRKSRDGRKSREANSRGKSRDAKSRERAGTPKRENPMEGLVRKGSGGFVTVEQFCKDENQGQETVGRVTFNEEHLLKFTDLTGDAGAEEQVPEFRGNFQVAEPSGEKVLKHECELTNCCTNDFKGLREDGRKAMYEYGKLLLNKRLAMDAKRKARASSRSRSRGRIPESSTVLSIPVRDFPAQMVLGGLGVLVTLIFFLLAVIFKAGLFGLIF